MVSKTDAWKLFIVSFTLLILSWTPFIVANYPGAVCYDTLKQLKQYSGEIAMNASNPLLVTVIFGALFELGRELVSDNFGIFLNVVFQTVLCAAAMARACIWVKRLSASTVMYVFALGFFMLVPTWGAAVQCVIKDVIHLGFFLLYFVSYIKIVYSEQVKRVDYGWFVVHALLAAYTRKAAFAIVVLSIIVLLIYRLKERESFRRTVASFLVILIAYSSIEAAVYSNPQIEKPMERENYSLPFQMIARYCNTYGDEMSEEEIAVIDAVLDFDVIAEKYDPSISDAVKATFHATSSEMKDFWRLFIDLGCKHPQEYIKHFIAGTYKYVYPLTTGTGTYRRYIQKDENFYQVDYVDKQAHAALAKYFGEWESRKGLELLIGPGLYAWLIVFWAGFMVRNKSIKGIVGFMPVYILFIGLFLTHVNGENRYAYPLIASAPLCFAIGSLQIRKKREEKTLSI